MPESEPIGLIDLDGSVADFDYSMERGLASIASPDEPPITDENRDEPWAKARRRLIKSQPGFWRNLHRIPEGFHVVELLRKHDYSLNVLTKGPASNPTAWAEKVEWCQEHLPDASITVTEDKGLVYGKVLLDDWPDYIRRWLTWRPRGQIIMLDQPWNQGFEHPNVFRYTGSPQELTTIDMLLGRIRNR